MKYSRERFQEKNVIHQINDSLYEDIESGLVALRKYLIDQGSVSVALPALGCGNGGLDWQRVSSMIYDHLQGLDARIKLFGPSQYQVNHR